MSKKSARKARERQQPTGVDRTPTTANAGAKVAGRGDDFSPLQRPQISEAAKGQAEEAKVEQPAEATEVLETLSREEQIEALPSLRAVTGAKGDVEQYTSILLWALRSTASRRRMLSSTSALVPYQCFRQLSATPKTQNTGRKRKQQNTKTQNTDQRLRQKHKNTVFSLVF